MKPTIEEVNSLLKLGAVFMAPVGAIVLVAALWDGGLPVEYTVTGVNRQFADAVNVSKATDYGEGGFVINVWNIVAYVCLPIGCPPIEQWERLDDCVVD